MTVRVTISRYSKDGDKLQEKVHVTGEDFKVMETKDGCTGPLAVTDSVGKTIAVYNSWESAEIV